VGERHGAGVEEFSRKKRILQRVGSAAVRAASRTDVPDTTSGFRAYTREAALRINVLGQFTYTLESLIQAGRSGLAVGSAPVRTNPAVRRSRLFSSTSEYLVRSGTQVAPAYAPYAPLRTFFFLAALALTAAVVIFARFLFYFVENGSAGHIQSLILGGVLAMAAFQVAAIGILGDLLSANRRLIERVLVRVRRMELTLDEKGNELEVEDALERTPERGRDPRSRPDDLVSAGRGRHLGRLHRRDGRRTACAGPCGTGRLPGGLPAPRPRAPTGHSRERHPPALAGAVRAVPPRLVPADGGARRPRGRSRPRALARRRR